MKNKVSIIIVAFAALSCTEKLVLPEEPVVTSTNLLEFNSPLMWTTDSKVGVYGSEEGDNASYVPMNEFIGTTGTARLYGASVNGVITAYYPYNEAGYPGLKSGTLIFGSQQRYCTSAEAQLVSNSVMVGSGSVDDQIPLAWMAGVMHFRLNTDLAGDITGATLESASCDLSGTFAMNPAVSPRLYGGGRTLSLTGLYVEETGASRPVDLWFVLPIGEYRDLSISIYSAKGLYARRVGGTYSVEGGKLTEVTGVDVYTPVEGGDLPAVPGEFDNL